MKHYSYISVLLIKTNKIMREKIKVELTFVNVKKKEIIKTEVESFYDEVFITGDVDENWLTYLAEKVLEKDLDGFHLDGFSH